MPKQETRAQMALRALELIVDISVHRDICLAVQNGKYSVCDWQVKKGAEFDALVKQIFSGKNARPKIPGVTSGECPANVWFDKAALERARSRNNLEVIK